MLTLRRIGPADTTPPVRMLAQVVDESNVELPTATGVDDFIVSGALASLMLAQPSERAGLQAVFDDLFDPDGAVIELRPAPQFVADEELTYAQLAAAGITRAVSFFRRPLLPCYEAWRPSGGPGGEAPDRC